MVASRVCARGSAFTLPQITEQRDRCPVRERGRRVESADRGLLAGAKVRTHRRGCVFEGWPRGGHGRRCWGRYGGGRVKSNGTPIRGDAGVPGCEIIRMHGGGVIHRHPALKGERHQRAGLLAGLLGERVLVPVEVGVEFKGAGERGVPPIPARAPPRVGGRALEQRRGEVAGGELGAGQDLAVVVVGKGRHRVAGGALAGELVARTAAVEGKEVAVGVVTSGSCDMLLHNTP